MQIWLAKRLKLFFFKNTKRKKKDNFDIFFQKKRKNRYTFSVGRMTQYMLIKACMWSLSSQQKNRVAQN